MSRGPDIERAEPEVIRGDHFDELFRWSPKRQEVDSIGPISFADSPSDGNALTLIAMVSFFHSDG